MHWYDVVMIIGLSILGIIVLATMMYVTYVMHKDDGRNLVASRRTTE